MVARVSTVAFQGIEGVPVEVQVMISPGKLLMPIVGLPDKRWRKAGNGYRWPCKPPACRFRRRRSPSTWHRRIFPRKASHFDLAIALGLMAALGVIPGDALSD